MIEIAMHYAFDRQLHSESNDSCCLKSLDCYEGQWGVNKIGGNLWGSMVVMICQLCFLFCMNKMSDEWCSGCKFDSFLLVCKLLRIRIVMLDQVLIGNKQQLLYCVNYRIGIESTLMLDLSMHGYNGLNKFCKFS